MITIEFKLYFLFSLLLIFYSKKIFNYNKNNKKILIFRKSAGIQDIHSAIKTGLIKANIYQVDRDIIKKLFKFYVDKNDGEHLIKCDENYFQKAKNYNKFLDKSFRYLKGIWNLKAVIGFNIFYRPEFEIQKVCTNLNISFISCHKEGISSQKFIDWMYHLVKKINIKFYGKKILVYNQSVKKFFKKINLVNPNKIKVAGCSRADEQFKYRLIRSKNKKLNNNISRIIFFVMPENSILPSCIPVGKKHPDFKNNKTLNWNNYNNHTTLALLKFAKKNQKSCEIIFKEKISSRKNIKLKQFVEKFNLKNVKYINFGNSDELIKNSDIIIASYSTTTFEAIASGAKIIESRIGLKKDRRLKKYMINYKNLIPYANNSDELIKKIEHLMNINTKINRIPNNLKILLNNYLGNNDGKSSSRMAKEINKAID
tara:strand:+ start:16609 stop:17889 length:1281 start_codon:yes stop_codon:yes gene_type:complete